jgi:hypothetical protein
MSSNLNVTMYISEQLSNQMLKMVQDVTHRCIMECSSKYGFDGEEAMRFLNLNDIKMERKRVIKSKGEKPIKILTPKAAFPLPYNGELNENCCLALRQNNGLYTQCTGQKKGENKFCKSCATTLQKTGSEMPEYGTIEQRNAVGIFEYVDPKGRKPIAYTKIMKKYKISEEDVLAEAGKLNIKINPEHFVAPEEDVKRGRPASQKEPKEKGAKGRPKKSKKVLEIEGDDEDLFASLIAQANEEHEEEMEVISKKKSGKSDEEKEAERLEKKLAVEKAKAEKEAKLAAEKAEKEAKLALEKAEKEAKKEAERLEREAKKEAERLEREAKKKLEEEEKAAKKLAAEKAKAEKEAAKKAPKATVKKVEEEDEEPDVVKKIEFEGKKYLKSKKTGIIYDYTEYTKNGDQVVVGKWNDASNKIDFNKTEEEEEEEYDM